jgi:elongation factor G
MAAKDTPPDLGKIRNLGIIAHIDAGKTTTTEHILYYAGAVHRLGGVDEGNTTTDYDEEEQERGITIYSACIPLSWQGHTINLIDTPGHVDFTAEVERSLRVLDGCAVVFDAQKGVEAQSETVWRQADKYRVPRMVFVNKMDVVGANFENCLEEIRERLEGNPVALTIPIGAGSIKDSARPFEAVIDLLEMKARYFAGPDQGRTVLIEPIPDDMVETAQAWREKLFDVLTQYDEQDLLTSAYLEGGEIPLETVRQAIRELTLKRIIQPVFCGSGREHIGIQALMDAVCWYLPSPLDRPPVTGINPQKKDKEEKRKTDPKEPFCGLVFKIVADTHGDLFFLRIYSGVLKPQSRPFNPGRQAKEMVSKIYHTHADPTRRDEVPLGYAGDIVALLGLKDSITGDTLCDPQHPILLERITFNEPVVSKTIEPESSADRQKLLDVLNRLGREDPTFRWKEDPETGQTLMSGMGVLHLEIKQHRMERDFNLKVRVGRPLVGYRETIRRAVRVEGEPPKSLGSNLVAKVTVELDPFKSEEPITVVNRLDSEVVPAAFSAAAERGVRDGLATGEMFPLMNVRATLVDAHIHPELSSDKAFEAAGGIAVRNALEDNIILLEPIMRVEVAVPEEYLGPVQSDLMARRGEIKEVIYRGRLRTVEALVPLSEMFDYTESVRSLSQGRATPSMEPHSYGPAPNEVLHRMLHPEEYY